MHQIIAMLTLLYVVLYRGAEAHRSTNTDILVYQAQASQTWYTHLYTAIQICLLAVCWHPEMPIV